MLVIYKYYIIVEIYKSEPEPGIDNTDPCESGVITL